MTILATQTDCLIYDYVGHHETKADELVKGDVLDIRKGVTIRDIWSQGGLIYVMGDGPGVNLVVRTYDPSDIVALIVRMVGE